MKSRDFVAHNGCTIDRQTIQDYGRLFRRYGDAKTSLQLSKEAKHVYNECDLFNIFEVAIDIGDNYNNIFTLSYILVYENYQVGTFPAEKINTMLESWWDK